MQTTNMARWQQTTFCHRSPAQTTTGHSLERRGKTVRNKMFNFVRLANIIGPLFVNHHTRTPRQKQRKILHYPTMHASRH